MKVNEKISVFLVDDDAVFLKLLAIEFLESADFYIETFETGEICLQNLSKKPDIIILDYYLNSTVHSAMNGLQTLDAIHAIEPKIPIVIMSSQDKIEIAVNCMHHGAFDYVVKSETAFVRLQNIVEQISFNKKVQKKLEWYVNRM